MEIVEFKTNTPQTPFAVDFSYNIGIIDLSDCIDVLQMKEFLLSKEIELKHSFPNDGVFVGDWTDGDTGLGGDSITARFPHYTLWQFEEMDPLVKQVEKQLEVYLQKVGVEWDSEIYSQAWFNVMRKGEKIKTHRHTSDEYSYLSAHFTVSAKETYTHYFDPITGEKWSEPNYNGKLTIFPSWLPHETDMVSDDQQRITVAMDFLTKQGYIHNVSLIQKHRWYELEKGVKNV
jgi:hypothetical protein